MTGDDTTLSMSILTSAISDAPFNLTLHSHYVLLDCASWYGSNCEVSIEPGGSIHVLELVNTMNESAEAQRDHDDKDSMSFGSCYYRVDV